MLRCDIRQPLLNHLHLEMWMLGYASVVCNSPLLAIVIKFPKLFGHFSIKFMLPKRRFWMAERTFGIEFSNYFSKERSPNRVLTPLKNTSKRVPKRSSDFQNLRLGSIKLPKSVMRFFKTNGSKLPTHHAVVACCPAF
jgi:hypothetical protein